MYIVPIGWLYVTMMMAVVEATSATGTVIGAIITFVLYGLLPTGIMAYLMATPARKRAIKAREAQEMATPLQPAASDTAQVPPPDQVEPDLLKPNTGGHSPAAAPVDAVTPVRKEP